MKKPSERIQEKQRELIDEMSDKTDTNSTPFLNLLQGKTIDWIIEELDAFTPIKRDNE